MHRGWARIHFTLQWRLTNCAAGWRAAALLGAGWLAVVNSATAQGNRAPAVKAGAGGPVSIWYRSSEGCPDGAAFLGRLDELRRSARLASVGDRVDFVVTLAAESGKSSGRLERQTERGTVAIRDVGASECTEVAEALALSLDLALEPGAAVTLPVEVAPAPLSRDAVPVEAVAPLVGPTYSEAAEPAAVIGTAAEPPLRVGLQGTLTSGLSPALAGGAALFVEFGTVARDPSARLSVHGSYGSGTSDNGRLETTLVAGRLEGCAFGWDGGMWSIRPCLGADAGLLSSAWSAEGGHRDSGPWVSALGLVRAAVRIGPHLVPEAQIAGVVPFTRYVMGSPQTRDVFQIEPILLQLSVGARWAL